MHQILFNYFLSKLSDANPDAAKMAADGAWNGGAMGMTICVPLALFIFTIALIFNHYGKHNFSIKLILATPIVVTAIFFPTMRQIAYQNDYDALYKQYSTPSKAVIETAEEAATQVETILEDPTFDIQVSPPDGIVLSRIISPAQENVVFGKTVKTPVILDSFSMTINEAKTLSPLLATSEDKDAQKAAARLASK